ncbi:MAG: hypothetical protein ACRDRV_20445 [Pseudonocardiaceae bacterium]
MAALPWCPDLTGIISDVVDVVDVVDVSDVSDVGDVVDRALMQSRPQVRTLDWPRG